jgi:hypothetical protein
VKMNEIVECVVQCTGGQARSHRVAGDTLAIAKRLSGYWTQWKRQYSLWEVGAVNTDDPRVNEDRMRAVAIGVAVARGWIVPTKDGLALMRNSVAELDTARLDTSNNDEGDDD